MDLYNLHYQHQYCKFYWTIYLYFIANCDKILQKKHKYSAAGPTRHPLKCVLFIQAYHQLEPRTMEHGHPFLSSGWNSITDLSNCLLTDVRNAKIISSNWTFVADRRHLCQNGKFIMEWDFSNITVNYILKKSAWTSISPISFTNQISLYEDHGKEL